MNNEMKVKRESVEEAMSGLKHQIVEDVEAMIRLTCIVNLRVECCGCMKKLVQSRQGDFVGKHASLFTEDLEQYYRQMIVWAKETTEEGLAEPCSLGSDAKEIVGGLIEVAING